MGFFGCCVFGANVSPCEVRGQRGKGYKVRFQFISMLHVIHAPVVGFGFIARSLVLTLEVFFLKAVAAIYHE